MIYHAHPPNIIDCLSAKIEPLEYFPLYSTYFLPLDDHTTSNPPKTMLCVLFGSKLPMHQTSWQPHINKFVKIMVWLTTADTCNYIMLIN